MRLATRTDESFKADILAVEHAICVQLTLAHIRPQTYQWFRYRLKFLPEALARKVVWAIKWQLRFHLPELKTRPDLTGKYRYCTIKAQTLSSMA